MINRALISFLVMLIAVVSCERRPLVDLHNTHYVRVYIDEELRNVTHGFYNPEHQKPSYKSPSIVRVVLTDRNSGNVVHERYLRTQGEDKRGKYYDGYIVANPGCYNMAAYNFDTESSVMTGTGNLFNMASTSTEIASHLYSRIPSRSKSDSHKESIVYDPDHVFVVDCRDVVVPYVEELDTLTTHQGDYFVGKSITKSYYLQIRVKGMEYVSTSVALLNGMAGSVNLYGKDINENDEVTIYFETIKSHQSQGDETIIYATFNTFGRLPDKKQNLEITFDFMTTYGSHHTEKIDISGKFEEPDAINNQWLIIDHTIVIPEPPAPESGGNGGFRPEVEPWGDINTDIII